MSLWDKITRLGISDDMPIYKQKSTIFFNITMRITIFVLLAVASLMFFLKGMIYTPLGFLMGIPIILLSLYLNYKSRVTVSAFLVLIFFPFYFTGMSIFAKLHGEGLNLVFSIAPRFGIIIFSVAAFAVLGFENLKKAFLGVSSGFIAFLFFNQIHAFFGIHISELEFEKKDFDVIVLGTGGLFFFFTTITMFLQKINSQYEKIVTEQRNDLQQKNVEINSQKEEIEAQRDHVMEQHDRIRHQKKQITDSIQYASRIQAAVLPRDELMACNKMFVLFKPRDIVSGDFYWLKTINTQSGEYQIVVAADCTGHGVPGAFVSMLGISLLNDIVAKDKKPLADFILNELRDRIKKSLHQKEKGALQRDGMDMTVCIINREKMSLEFAGANNPLYLILNESADNERFTELAKNPKVKIHSIALADNSSAELLKLVELKGDKMPVGIYIKEQPFEKHSIKVEAGDTFYIFSDGYVDQFGGKNGEKFKVRNFRKLLLSISKKNLSEQQEILNKTFENWKTDHKQIDDVLVVAYRI